MFVMMRVCRSHITLCSIVRTTFIAHRGRSFYIYIKIHKLTFSKFHIKNMRKQFFYFVLCASRAHKLPPIPADSIFGFIISKKFCLIGVQRQGRVTIVTTVLS